LDSKVVKAGRSVIGLRQTYRAGLLRRHARH